MGPSLVVVLEPLSQDALKVPTMEERQPVQTLAPGRANLAIDVRICPRGRDRSPDHGHAVALEHQIGPAAVLGVVIVDQESRMHPKLAQFPADISGLLGYPGSVWAVGYRQPDHSPGRQFHI